MPVFGVKEWKNQSSVWEPFPGYSAIIKIATLGYERIWLKKIYRSCIWPLFLPRPEGVKIEFIFALRTAVFEIRADFRNCHIWAWNLEFENIARSCIWTLSYPIGLKLSLFLLYERRFPWHGLIFKIAIFGHETRNVTKVLEVAYEPSFYPRGSKMSSFKLYGQALSR